MPGRLLLVLGLLLVPLLAGCDDEEPAGPVEPQAVSGFWVGQTDPDRPPIGPIASRTEQDTVEIFLEENAQGRIVGSGSIRGRGAGSAFTVEGVNQFPFVFLTLFGGQTPTGSSSLISLRAEFVGPGTLSGRLTGDRFDNVRVRLRMQPPRVGL